MVTFADLFSGIGAFRQAFESLGAKCVFSCDIDKFAKQTYKANYGERPYGDIRFIPLDSYPSFDVLCAGFPCQPFSKGGLATKRHLGTGDGFDDMVSGNIFFALKEVIKYKRPKVIFLENVKNLLHHDKGNTFGIIKQILEEECNYVIHYSVVDGSKWVPQNRKRLFIVGYDKSQFNIPSSSIIIADGPEPGYVRQELSDIIDIDEPDFFLPEGTWQWLISHKANQRANGNNFGYTLIPLPITESKCTNTISSRYNKDGSECLLGVPGKPTPRKLSIRELKLLFGFPESFKVPVSNKQAYRQFGNSIIVPAIKSSAIHIMDSLS
jgi:DNA (cytosine-5)-methyltransferase 1